VAAELLIVGGKAGFGKIPVELFLQIKQRLTIAGPDPQHPRGRAERTDTLYIDSKAFIIGGNAFDNFTNVHDLPVFDLPQEFQRQMYKPNIDPLNLRPVQGCLLTQLRLQAFLRRVSNLSSIPSLVIDFMPWIEKSPMVNDAATVP